MSKTKESDQKDKEDIKTTVSEIKHRNRVFAVMILGLVLLFGGLMYSMYVNHASPEQPQTFNELYNATLNGFETENNYLYNDYVFIWDGSLWKTLVQRRNAETFLLSTHYDPRSLEDIPTDPGLRNIIETKHHVALTASPNLTARSVTGIYDLGRIIGNRFNFLNKETTLALLAENGSNSSVPIVTCENVTPTYGVIAFSLANDTAVRVKDGCVLVQGPTEDDIVRASDRLLFILLGVMPEKQPDPTSFRLTVGSADWKDGPALDGLLFRVRFFDALNTSISPEGMFKILAESQNVTLEKWEFPLTLDQYNMTGTADLRLGTNISDWPDKVNLYVGFQARSGKVLSTVAQLDRS